MSAQVTQFFVEVLGILRDASASVHSERRDCWTASPGDVFDKVKAAADRACAPDGGAAEVRAALEETTENIEFVAGFFDRYAHPSEWPDSCGPAIALLRALRERVGSAPTVERGEPWKALAAPVTNPAPAGEGPEAGTNRRCWWTCFHAPEQHTAAGCSMCACPATAAPEDHAWRSLAASQTPPGGTK